MKEFILKLSPAWIVFGAIVLSTLLTTLFITLLTLAVKFFGLFGIVAIFSFIFLSVYVYHFLMITYNEMKLEAWAKDQTSRK